MSKIKILPENLANQIAAGEVIERPASVVKEFVENAVDARASRIIVEVEGSGSKLIRVIDDGEGMDQDDMLLSLERHATSKLQKVEQLSSILTLGFRGEAIPSIASVARLSITSRIKGSSLGNRAEIRFGQLRKVHEMGCSQGTVMELRDLFGNVPARKKFLKTVRTELSHIEEIAINTALAFPALGLTYRVNGKVVWDFSTKADTLALRVKKIMGRNSRNPFVELNSSQDELAVYGLLLAPDEPQRVASKLRIFVNNRAVRDRMISHGVMEGMHGFLMKGRRPAGVIFLTLNPQWVDVNVHPTKQEIRFHQSQQIHALVVSAVSKAMAGYQKNIQHAVFGKADEQQATAEPLTAKVVSLPLGKKSQPVKVEEPVLPYEQSSQPVFSPPRPVTVPDVKPGQGKISEKFTPALSQTESDIPVIPAAQSAPRFGLRYVGQFMQCYLLCESRDGIVVIDQHAAHERLIFERLKKQYHALDIPGQALLFPEMIECSPTQSEVLKKYGKEIARLGIVVEEFGGESYAIKSVPAILGHLGPLEIVNGIFDHYLGRKSKSQPTRIDDVLSVMACKAAVKANDKLLPAEGEELIRQMEEADVFSHCPHGRPVLKVFAESEIKKWFYR